jgi:hypothetical protein
MARREAPAVVQQGSRSQRFCAFRRAIPSELALDERREISACAIFLVIARLDRAIQ